MVWGHPPTQRSVAMSTQAALAGQRRRKVEARGVLARQIHAQVDLAFPQLTACYSHGLNKPSLRIILAHICDPVRIVRLGPKRLRDYVVNRGVEAAITRAGELALLATHRRNFGWQKAALYGENAALNTPHGAAHMLKNMSEFVSSH